MNIQLNSHASKTGRHHCLQSHQISQLECRSSLAALLPLAPTRAEDTLDMSRNPCSRSWHALLPVICKDAACKRATLANISEASRVPITLIGGLSLQGPLDTTQFPLLCRKYLVLGDVPWWLYKGCIKVVCPFLVKNPSCRVEVFVKPISGCWLIFFF